MRVLQVHNFYREEGGEDAVVGAEASLLRSYGHEVRLCSAHNDDIRGLKGVLRTACSLGSSPEADLRLRTEIRLFGPDIVHVHNYFPLFTPSVFAACRAAGVPVIHTLHNYRPVCPGALLLRNGRACEDCVGRSTLRSVSRRCYRRSGLATLAVAVAIGSRRRQWMREVDAFIALTEFSRGLFVRGGFPPERIAVKPNFCFPVAGSGGEHVRKGGLYLGRLSEEKGIRVLLDAWRDIPADLHVAGDGPLRDIVASADGAVRPLGRIDRAAVGRALVNAEFLVVPSLCHENFPVAVAEAYAAGTPVIASRTGSLAEIIREGETGLLFEAANPASLAATVRYAFENPEKMRRMGAAAAQMYREHFSPEKNYRRYMEICSKVLSRP